MWFLRTRGECRFEGCCARTRTATAKASADSDYESNSGADNARGDSALSSSGDRGEHDGWKTPSSGGGSSSADYWGGGGCCSDEDRFAALGEGGREEDSVRGAGLLVDEPGFRFSECNGRVTHRQQATEQKAAAKAATAQEEGALAAALAAA